MGAIANSLVFWSDDEPLLVMTSGAHRVDTAALAERLGRGAIRRATPEQVLAATGQPIGGVAPTGHPAALTTVVDEDLAAFDEIWAAGGTPHTVFPLTFDELVRVTGGRSSAWPEGAGLRVARRGAALARAPLASSHFWWV